MALADQVVTLAAVVVGAAGSYLAVRLSERDRFRRELKIRWDQRRLDACIAFVSAAKLTGTCANRIHAQRLSGNSATAARHIEDVASNDLRRAEAFETLAFLTDAPTVAAAHTLNEAVYGLESPIRGGAILTESEWHERADRWIKAINNFHEAARTELGVSGTLARRDVAALAISRPERDPTRHIRSTQSQRPEHPHAPDEFFRSK